MASMRQRFVSHLILGTTAISMDELCFSLREKIEPAPDSKGTRRYQVVKVIRFGDKITEFRRDLGPAETFECPEFIIPGGVTDNRGRIEILHTVGELIDIANGLHDGGHRAAEPPEPSDLMGQWQDELDQKRLARRARSLVGPLVRVQRD